MEWDGLDTFTRIAEIFINHYLLGVSLGRREGRNRMLGTLPG